MAATMVLENGDHRPVAVQLEQQNAVERSEPAASEHQDEQPGSSSQFESHEECSICLGQFVNRATLDGCSHAFCLECITRACKIKACCPLCRADIKEITTATGTIPAPVPEREEGASDLDDEQYDRHLESVQEEVRAFRAHEREMNARFEVEATGGGRNVNGEVVRPSTSDPTREEREQRREQRRVDQSPEPSESEPSESGQSEPGQSDLSDPPPQPTLTSTDGTPVSRQLYDGFDGSGDEGEVESEASGAETDTTRADPIQLLTGGDAEQAERARAINQATHQGFEVPLRKKQPLPQGWAIGKTADANPASGRDFMLLCVLARGRCSGSGGDVITYQNNKVARVLLSPRGVAAFQRVRASITPKLMEKLRKKPKLDQPPVELIADLMAAGLFGSMDSGLPLPDTDPNGPLFHLWWRHHCLSCDAMSANAPPGAVEAAVEAAKALYEKVKE